MISPEILEILLEVLKAILGVAVPALTIWLGFYTRRISKKMEQKALQNEVDRLTTVATQTRTFEEMDFDLKVLAIVESLQLYARQNDIIITDTELQMLVEKSFTSLKTLERIGKNLYKLHRLSEEKDG
jgi:hypothetical protein